MRYVALALFVLVAVGVIWLVLGPMGLLYAVIAVLIGAVIGGVVALTGRM